MHAKRTIASFWRIGNDELPLVRHQPQIAPGPADHVSASRQNFSFTVAGAEAYRRDDPGPEVHILDAGHFALDLKAKEIIGLTEAFLDKQQIK